MNSVFLILVGAVIGWVLEWLYDIFLWRNKQKSGVGYGNSDLEIKLASSEAGAKKLNQELETLKGKLKGAEKGTDKDNEAFKAAQKELEQLKGKLGTALGELSQLKARQDNSSGAMEKLGQAQNQLKVLGARVAELDTLSQRFQESEAEVNSLKMKAQGKVDDSVHQTVQNELQMLQAKTADFNDLNNRFEANQKDLESFKAQLHQMVDPEQFADVNQQLKAAQLELERRSQMTSEGGSAGTGAISAELEEEIQHLKGKLAQMVESDHHQNVVDHLHGELEGLKTELSNRVDPSHHQNLLGELEHLKAELSNRIHPNEHQALIGQLESLKTSSQGMVESQKLSELQAQWHSTQSQLEGQIHDLRSQLETASEQAQLDDSKRDQHYSDLQHKLNNQTETLQALQSDLQQRDTELQQAKGRLGQLSDLEHEVVTLRGEAGGASHLQAQLGIAEQEIEGLRSQLGRMVTPDLHDQVHQELLGVKNQLEVHLQSSQSSAGEQTQQIVDLRNQLEQRVPKSEFEALEAKFSSLVASTVARQQFEQLNGEAEGLRHELAQFKSEVALLRPQNALLPSLEAELTEARSRLNEMDGLRLKVMDADNRLQNFQSQLEQSVPRSDFESLQARVQGMVERSSLESQQHQTEELRQVVQNLKHQLETLSSLEQEVLGLRAENSQAISAQAQLSVAEQELDSLREQLEGERKATVPLASHQLLETNLETLRADFNTLLEESDHLRVHSRQLAELQNQAAHTVAQSQAELEGLRLQLSQYTSVQAQLQNAQHDLDTLRSKVAEDTELRKKLDASEDEMSIMKAQMANMVGGKEVEDLREELEQLRVQSKNASGQTAHLLSYIERLNAAETEISILKDRLAGKAAATSADVDTGAMGGALDDLFGGFMDGDKK